MLFWFRQLLSWQDIPHWRQWNSRSFWLIRDRVAQFQNGLNGLGSRGLLDFCCFSKSGFGSSFWTRFPFPFKLALCSGDASLRSSIIFSDAAADADTVNYLFSTDGRQKHDAMSAPSLNGIKKSSFSGNRPIFTLNLSLKVDISFSESSFNWYNISKGMSKFSAQQLQ